MKKMLNIDFFKWQNDSIFNNSFIVGLNIMQPLWGIPNHHQRFSQYQVHDNGAPWSMSLKCDKQTK